MAFEKGNAARCGNDTELAGLSLFEIHHLFNQKANRKNKKELSQIIRTTPIF
jgi:hypothetical protein